MVEYSRRLLQTWGLMPHLWKKVIHFHISSVIEYLTRDVSSCIAVNSSLLLLPLCTLVNESTSWRHRWWAKPFVLHELMLLLRFVSQVMIDYKTWVWVTRIMVIRNRYLRFDVTAFKTTSTLFVLLVLLVRVEVMRLLCWQSCRSSTSEDWRFFFFFLYHSVDIGRCWLSVFYVICAILWKTTILRLIHWNLLHTITHEIHDSR